MIGLPVLFYTKEGFYVSLPNQPPFHYKTLAVHQASTLQYTQGTFTLS
jgi:hypothetical protein